MIDFKENISKKAAELQNHRKNGMGGNVENEHILSSLVQYIYDYPRITFTKEDVEKRKRAKNVVPLCDRCIAKRAADIQCTRKKKTGHEFCGTHLKGTPHGLAIETEGNLENEGSKTDESNNSIKKEKKTKVEVWAQDIQGIMNFIDKLGNVYNAEDVIRNKPNPGIVAKYSKIGDKYSIVPI